MTTPATAIGQGASPPPRQWPQPLRSHPPALQRPSQGCGSAPQTAYRYISLGWYERDDVQTVIDYLRRENNAHPTSTIALWGRSMGAVSAVFQAARDPGIAGVTL